MRRVRRDPVALPLALLALDLAGWNIATVTFQLTNDATWHWVDVTLSPWTPPLVLWLIAAYAGLVQRVALAQRLAFIEFGALSVVSACAFVMPWARDFVEGPVWSVLYLGGWLPIMVMVVTMLVRELRLGRDVPARAMRARLLIAAVVAAGTLGSTELLDDLMEVPQLGTLGAFIAMVIIAAVVLRFELLVQSERRAMAVYAVVLGIAGATVIAIVSSSPGRDVPLVLLVSGAVIAVLVIAVRELAQSVADRRARANELAGVARFSAQMAHDLKNPLAALKGAMQVLEGARAEAGQAPAGGAAAELEAELWPIMAAQVGRMETILERYRRLARVEVVASAFDPEALAAEVARHLTVGRESVRLLIGGVATGGEAASGAAAVARPPWHGDRELLASAIENIVHNALDAMPEGGTLDVTTAREGDAVTLAFRDSGVGIEPRYLAKVADDFVTTKAHGSGLGLAFARRVALAHDGALRIASAPGEGTTVTLVLMDRRSPTP